ncbi:MAG: hypothetical protein QNL12_03080 [Acidimicrobiia bacterium]|nr:hypothetical protein [Acidimicrobiia bacterium]
MANPDDALIFNRPAPTPKVAATPEPAPKPAPKKRTRKATKKG